VSDLDPARLSAVTRRQFLGIAGAGAFLLAGDEGLNVGKEMWAQERAWAEAAADNDSFLRDHARTFRNVAIGASFAPEQWRASEGGDEAALPGLRWAVEELGLRQIRLGLRWQRTESRRGVVDLTAYRPFLDYAFGNGLELCLNLGPIRTFRWPEEHLPAWASEVELPPSGATVREGSPLAAAAADYHRRLLDALASEYGRSALASVAIVQVENEPFYRMRTHHWRLDREYVANRVAEARAAFPASRVLVTSAGRLDFGPVRDLFVDLMARDAGLRDGGLVLGFDYHYKTPLRDSFPIIRYTDPITFARVGYQTCAEKRDEARRLGYGIEVTEGQAEPNGYMTQPGNSARHFRFMLLRCAESVLDASRPSVIRVWGIEEMAKKALAGRATAEHEAMFDLMRRLNGAA
jgi:hypothetical protein